MTETAASSCLKTYICDPPPNFGDRLNYPILSLFGRSAVSVPHSECDIVCIGSMLNPFVKNTLAALKRHFIDNKGRPAKPVHVWGTGFIKNPRGLRWFIREPIIHALRGQLTLKRCQSILGRKLRNVVLGDPGLLASRLVDAKNVEKQFDVGIIPHMSDKNSVLLNNIRLEKHSFTVIDVADDPISILRQIASCRCILSSAMHGLIAADALNVPNKWILLDAHRKKYRWFKFRDYYSIYDMMPPPWKLDERIFTDQDVARIVDEYQVPGSTVSAVRDALAAAFPATI